MKRIISLLPSATEIIYALGAAEHLVGVTHECDFPEEVRARPRVTGARITPEMDSAAIDALVREQLDDTGSLYTLDMDLVRRLRPQIVLTQQLCTVCAVGYGTVREAMRSLEEPPEVVNLEPRNLQEVFESFVSVGDMLGLHERAVERTQALRERLSRIPGFADTPRVLFLEWLIPPFSAGHWMAELVTAAGARPVLANLGEHSLQLSWEAIQGADFDVLVVSCCGFNVERTMRDVRSCPELRSLLQERPALRLIVFDGNHFFSRPGPRLVESAELLHHALACAPADAVQSSVPMPYREAGGAELVD